MRTYKRSNSIRCINRKHKKTRKRNTRLVDNQYAGGIFTTSNKERILNNLLKTSSINKEQKNEILKAVHGNNKTDKINSFVDKCVEILLANTYAAWQQIPGDIKQSSGLSNFGKLLSNPIPSSISSQRELTNKLSSAFDSLSETDRFKLTKDGLEKIKLATGQNGGLAFQSLYQLYISWIRPNTIATLPDPKFADLHFVWFKKRIKTWFEKYWWVLWITS